MDDKLVNKIVEHEGIRKYAYTDTTGHITVGVGRNLSQGGEGLSTDEIFYLLKNDIARIQKDLSNYSWFKSLNDVRQGALVELAFNVGVSGLLGFNRMIGCLDAKNYAGAAKELQNSTWATQVSIARSKDMVERLSYGRYL